MKNKISKQKTHQKIVSTKISPSQKFVTQKLQSFSQLIGSTDLTNEKKSNQKKAKQQYSNKYIRQTKNFLPSKKTASKQKSNEKLAQKSKSPSTDRHLQQLQQKKLLNVNNHSSTMLKSTNSKEKTQPKFNLIQKQKIKKLRLEPPKRQLPKSQPITIKPYLQKNFQLVLETGLKQVLKNQPDDPIRYLGQLLLKSAKKQKDITS